jgi:hypothetical protein
MPRCHWFVRFAATALICMAASGQRPTQTRTRPSFDFPPDVIEPNSVDVVRIAPNRYSIEMENPQARVLRARIPALGRVTIHSHHAGLLVAFTEVHLRLLRPNGASEEIHVPAGAARWLHADTHSEENMVMSPCEFLFVETKTAN